MMSEVEPRFQSLPLWEKCLSVAKAERGQNKYVCAQSARPLSVSFADISPTSGENKVPRQ